MTPQNPPFTPPHQDKPAIVVSNRLMSSAALSTPGSIRKRPLGWQETGHAGLGSDDVIQYWFSDIALGRGPGHVSPRRSPTSTICASCCYLGWPPSPRRLGVTHEAPPGPTTAIASLGTVDCGRKTDSRTSAAPPWTGHSSEPYECLMTAPIGLQASVLSVLNVSSHTSRRLGILWITGKL